MGRVFLAEDTVLKRHVALKLLPAKHRDGRPNHRTERLVREARSAASLEHPNAVNIYEIDQSGGVHYIAMELVEGGNLEKLVQMSGPMEIERACQLIAEAAEALSHAHMRGIIHRDVKPANLLLTRSGRCKVCDFGLALFDDEPDAEGRTQLRRHAVLHRAGGRAGERRDAGIGHLLAGLHALFPADRPPAVRGDQRARADEGGTSASRCRTCGTGGRMLPERLVAAIEQACAKDPAERFECAEHFGKLLRTFTISAGGSGGSGSALPSFSGAAGGSDGMVEPMSPISAAQLESILPAAAMRARQRRAYACPRGADVDRAWERWRRRR